mmetsp:Transcript_84746/g.168309  ORF Transcript_84746/g.168309 Transcript_84746/m.168309 type:complete len:155 (-) Transcript_84746:1128-1592(-)
MAQEHWPAYQPVDRMGFCRHSTNPAATLAQQLVPKRRSNRRTGQRNILGCMGQSSFQKMIAGNQNSNDEASSPPTTPRTEATSETLRAVAVHNASTMVAHTAWSVPLTWRLLPTRDNRICATDLAVGSVASGSTQYTIIASINRHVQISGLSCG